MSTKAPVSAICPCDGEPMRFPECQRCVQGCLEQVFRMDDTFVVLRDGDGIRVASTKAPGRGE